MTLLAIPKSSKAISFKSTRISSSINLPPVTIAISSKNSFLLSPKLGAFIATELKVPRNLFTIRVASASPYISSTINNNGLF